MANIMAYAIFFKSIVAACRGQSYSTKNDEDSFPAIEEAAFTCMSRNIVLLHCQ